ncbi:MAG: hypothetical protein HYX26_02020 [Acidobacteriales bacterium]|nr:hypothetical protein [Terriglobales bacterium]
MDMTRFALAALAGGFVSTFTDWFFFGVLFHDKNKVHPEVWRPEIQEGKERKAIILSSLLCFVTSAAFVFSAQRLYVTDMNHALKLAVAVWTIIALPMVVTNYLFIKLHPALLVSHSLGWLARLLVCAVATGLIVK